MLSDLDDISFNLPLLEEGGKEVDLITMTILPREKKDEEDDKKAVSPIKLFFVSSRGSN
jgi:hypothetical protein